jgi:hypothetical protein
MAQTPYDKARIARAPSRVIRQYGTWRTSYGRILVVFVQTKHLSEHNSVHEDFSTQGALAAQIVIHPNSSCVPPNRIVLDLNLHLNPSAKITYQEIIPNTSEVFSIIEYGQLDDLLRALEDRTARLTDRDEEGRSLLNVSQVTLKFSKKSLRTVRIMVSPGRLR